MTDKMRRQTLAVAAIAGLALSAGQVQAAQCGSNAAGFETWKRQFSEEARGRASAASLAALQNTTYSTATISADRGQHSFKLSLDQFLANANAKNLSRISLAGRRRRWQRSIHHTAASKGLTRGARVRTWPRSTSLPPSTRGLEPA